ncbi:dna repair protein [Lasius niger]|uniref:Dna repair protein n=1 Tax=Lasius niger TaxID=67767 RepID=A0A0J7K8X4_LASNI|nr:dna repair protein [Lasius niger]
MTMSLQNNRWLWSLDLFAWPVNPDCRVGSWLCIQPRHATTDLEHMMTKRAIWKAVMMTLTASHPKEFANIVTPKLLARWIIRAGVRETVIGLKELAFQYRKWAVTGEKPAMVSQIPTSFQT